jgi:hypothetical protein
MDEDLRGGLARLEMSRRGRGLGTDFGAVAVDCVRLQALGDHNGWVALRVEGRREAFPWGEAPEEAESFEVHAFTEWWSLRPTGLPERPGESTCGSCGAPVAFEEAHCRHCGTAPRRVPGPWLVEGIVIRGQGPAVGRLHLHGKAAFMPKG